MNPEILGDRPEVLYKTHEALSWLVQDLTDAYKRADKALEIVDDLPVNDTQKSVVRMWRQRELRFAEILQEHVLESYGECVAKSSAHLELYTEAYIEQATNEAQADGVQLNLGN